MAIARSFARDREILEAEETRAWLCFAKRTTSDLPATRKQKQEEIRSGALRLARVQLNTVKTRIPRGETQTIWIGESQNNTCAKIFEEV